MTQLAVGLEQPAKLFILQTENFLAIKEVHLSQCFKALVLSTPQLLL